MKVRSMRMTNVLLGALFVAVIAQPLVATADHQPANKVVANGQKVVAVGEAGDVPDGTTILESTFKASKPTDLMVHVTLECSILTELKNEGGGPPDEGARTSFTEAEGRIQVWLELNGKVVTINQVSENPQPHNEQTRGDDTDYVTFCENERRQRITDAEDPRDGHDTYETYLRTKQANGFNWIILNTGGWGGTNNGIHKLEVKADLETREVAAPPHTARATGFIGNRTVIIEPTKMSNHASV